MYVSANEEMLGIREQRNENNKFFVSRGPIVQNRSKTAFEDISMKPDGNMVVRNDGRGLSSSYW